MACGQALARLAQEQAEREAEAKRIAAKEAAAESIGNPDSYLPIPAELRDELAAQARLNDGILEYVR